jgi:hypothetical protein
VAASAGASLLLGAAGGLAMGELANAILSMQSTRLQESGGCLRPSRRAIVVFRSSPNSQAGQSSARVFMRLEVGDSGGDSKDGVRSYYILFLFQSQYAFIPTR